MSLKLGLYEHKIIMPLYVLPKQFIFRHGSEHYVSRSFEGSMVAYKVAVIPGKPIHWVYICIKFSLITIDTSIPS